MCYISIALVRYISLLLVIFQFTVLTMQLLIVFLAVLFTFVNALSHMKAAIAEMDEFTEKAIEEEDRSIESLLPYLNDHRDKIVSKFNLDKDTFIQHHRQLSFWREEKDCTQRVKPKYGNAKPDWMSTLDRNMNFTQLTLPGTHDSGAYALTTSMNTYDPVYIQLRVLIEKFKFPKHLLGRAMCKFSLTQSKVFMLFVRSCFLYYPIDDIRAARGWHSILGFASRLRSRNKYLPHLPRTIR